MYRIECIDGMKWPGTLGVIDPFLCKADCQLEVPIVPRACCLPHLHPPGKEQASVHSSTIMTYCDHYSMVILSSTG